MTNVNKKNILTIRHLIYVAVILSLVVFHIQNNLYARQFRQLTPIATPAQKPALPKGAKAVKQVQQLPRDKVEPIVKEIIEKWNSPEMASTLSDQFYDKSRLLDVMNTGVPREARLRVQSVQGIQTLDQYVTRNEASGRDEMVSIVSATVRTQLEFNNNAGGFEAETGTNELLLKITSTTK